MIRKKNLFKTNREYVEVVVLLTAPQFEALTVLVNRGLGALTGNFISSSIELVVFTRCKDI